MGQIVLAHVVQRLAGEGRVTDLRLRWKEGQRRIHQGRLAGGTAALNQDSQRLRQQTTAAGQVTGQLVRLFAHQAARFVVTFDACDEVGIAEQVERRLAPRDRQFERRFPRRGRFDLLLLQRFQGQQQLADVALDQRLVDIQLGGHRGDEGLPRPGLAEIERVQVDQILAAGQDVDPQLMSTQVPRQSTHAVASRVAVEVKLFALAAQFDGCLVGCVVVVISAQGERGLFTRHGKTPSRRGELESLGGRPPGGRIRYGPCVLFRVHGPMTARQNEARFRERQGPSACQAVGLAGAALFAKW